MWSSWTIAADGSFTGATTAITAPGSLVTGPLTFSGTLSGNTLGGTIAEINASFSTAADPTAGISSPVAGYYQGSSLDSSAGATYSIVGTQGEVFVVTLTPTMVTSGTGTVAANGAFTVQTPQSITISGDINPTTTTVVGTVTLPTGATTSFSGLSGSTTRTDRLINLSSRGSVSGSNILVSGLVIGGSAGKTVLLRAVGPGLSAFGVPGVLAQPHLQLLDSTGTVISDSTAWGGSSTLQAAFARIGAFPLVATSADAAILMTLAPVQYTLQVSNAGTDDGGIALAEIYDASANPIAEYQLADQHLDPRLCRFRRGGVGRRLHCRGQRPEDSARLRRRPGGLLPLASMNPLSNPLVTVYDSTGAIIAQNDDWGTPITLSAGQVAAAAAADIIAAELATGAFALSPGSEDSALILTPCLPGAYTAQVTGCRRHDRHGFSGSKFTRSRPIK